MTWLRQKKIPHLSRLKECFSKICHYYLLKTAYLLGVSFCNSLRNAVVSSLHFSDTFQAHAACQTNRCIRVTALHVNRSILYSVSFWVFHWFKYYESRAHDGRRVGHVTCHILPPSKMTMEIKTSRSDDGLVTLHTLKPNTVSLLPQGGQETAQQHNIYFVNVVMIRSLLWAELYSMISRYQSSKKQDQIICATLFALIFNVNNRPFQ